MNLTKLDSVYKKIPSFQVVILFLVAALLLPACKNEEKKDETKPCKVSEASKEKKGKSDKNGKKGEDCDEDDDSDGHGEGEPAAQVPYPFPALNDRVCTVDRFKQPTDGGGIVKKLDILFVMDNSGSMADDWGRVASNIVHMVRELPNDVDIRYGVVLGHVGTWKGRLYAPKKIDYVLDNQTMSVQQVSSDLHKIFTEAMKISDAGTGEATFYSLYHAVTSKAKENQDLGFFRPDAALSIIFMSDEHEIGFPFPNPQAPGLPKRCDASTEDKIKNDYYDKNGINLEMTYKAVKALKGDMPVVTHAFVNIDADDLFKRNSKNASCLYDSLGYGYFEMVDKTKGTLFSIQADKQEGMSRCGRVTKEALDLIKEFKLSKPSDQVDADTIMVAVDGYIQKFEYRVLTNTVFPEYAGKAGSDVEIRHCEPNSRVDWNLVGSAAESQQTELTVTFETPEYATLGKVKYGKTEAALNNEVEGTETTTKHKIKITGLNPNELYYVKAFAKDELGLEKSGDTLAIRTKPDWNIANFNLGSTRTTVDVSWSTPEYPTNGNIKWGLSSDSLVNSISGNSLTNNHRITISGLNPNTVIFVQATSSDQFGLVKNSDIISIQTQMDWGIVGFSVSAGENSASLKWSTPEETTVGRIWYGLNSNNLDQVTNYTTSGLSHETSVAGLAFGTTYYFRVEARDALGNIKTSGLQSAKTLEDWGVQDISIAKTYNSFTVNWNTGSVESSGALNWGLVNISLDNSAGYNSSNAHSVTINGLTEDTEHFFQIHAVDSLGRSRSSNVIAVRTEKKPIEDWSITNVSANSTKDTINFQWDTLEHATLSKVIWGASDQNLNHEITGSSYVNNHQYSITGLSADTIYYVQGISVDENGLEERTAIVPVKTLKDEVVPPQNWEVLGFDGTTTTDTATLIWQTPVVATKAVLYVGNNPSDLTLRVINIDTFSESHIHGVHGLNADTVYYFKVVATDQAGQTKESTVIMKRTKTP
ncbi:MAG: fibronectin type III domain-containing protein [Oligoflexia bacterium]|nr:fibronectin type III domain-containing protein [Oligoflexia bacterium]